MIQCNWVELVALWGAGVAVGGLLVHILYQRGVYGKRWTRKKKPEKTKSPTTPVCEIHGEKASLCFQCIRTTSDIDLRVINKALHSQQIGIMETVHCVASQLPISEEHHDTIISSICAYKHRT